MSLRLLIACALLFCTPSTFAAQPDKAAEPRPREVAPQDIDVDALARAKDVNHPQHGSSKDTSSQALPGPAADAAGNESSPAQTAKPKPTPALANHPASIRAANAQGKTEPEVAPQDIDVDALARAKDVKTGASEPSPAAEVKTAPIEAAASGNAEDEPEKHTPPTAAHRPAKSKVKKPAANKQPANASKLRKSAVDAKAGKESAPAAAELLGSASETLAPETPAPETPAPETPAPEMPAPETPAPETPAPETPAPETPAPETPAPETPAPTSSPTSPNAANPSASGSAPRAIPSPSPAEQQAQALQKACTARATALLDAAQKGDFDAATHDFDAPMRTALPPEKFKAAWESLARFGSLQARGQSHASELQGYLAITIPLIFDKVNLYAQIACGSDGRIAGFYVKPLEPPAQ